MSGRSRARSIGRQVPAGLTRKNILIFVEGDTEEQYLNHYGRIYRSSVLINIDRRRGSPMTLVRYAAAERRIQQRDERRVRGRSHDEIWCVFDRDEHPYITTAIVMARDNGIAVAFSNPCLELWFLLHFESQTSELDRHQAQSQAYRHLQCEPKKLSPKSLGLLVDKLAVAKEHAELLTARHMDNRSDEFSNPSSTVNRLLDSIAD